MILAFLTVVFLVITSALYYYVGICFRKALVFFFSIEGTALVAFSITFNIPIIGRGIKGKAKWIFIDFPKYGTTPGFNPFLFYLGLILLCLGMLLEVVL